jgi:hypothetical protein
VALVNCLVKRSSVIMKIEHNNLWCERCQMPKDLGVATLNCSLDNVVVDDFCPNQIVL